MHLREVTAHNVRAACDLRVEPGQERFVAPVAVSLAEAYAQPDLAWPRLVYDGDELVGFVMAEFDAAERFAGLWRLLIAAGHQRRGYGTFAVRAVIAEARDRGAVRLVTSYVPDPDGPGEFYEHLGFEPTGEVEDGEIVVRLDLSALDDHPAGTPAAHR